MNYWVLCRSELHSDRERGLGHVIEQKEIGKSGKQVSGREAIALFKQGEDRGQKRVKIMTFHVLWNVHRSRQHLLLGGLKEWLKEFERSPPQFPSLLHSLSLKRNSTQCSQTQTKLTWADRQGGEKKAFFPQPPAFSTLLQTQFDPLLILLLNLAAKEYKFLC